MNHNLCNNCGGEYEYRNGRWICRACGAYKPEEISNEEITLLYTAYQKLRLAEFEEAEKEFDDILRKYPENPNAYWGRLMAKYGIKYEEDFDGRMIPTCYATSIESVLSSADYQKALQYADEACKAYYAKQAEYIERVRREWVEKAKKEKPYDIFICYKDSDLENDIERTQDSIAAQDLYIHLTNKGYRVFFSHESLRDKVGEKYEPYIFNALSTSKVMIVYGSKPEYITSTWLKNEWTRYEKRIQKGEKKPNSLLVAYDGFSPSELPTVLSSMQCLNAEDKSFYSDLDDMVERIIYGETVAEKYEKKKKSKVPLAITALLLLALAAGFFGWYALGRTEAVMSVSNSSYNATAVIGEGGFPKGTEFRVKEVARNAALQATAATLSINQETYHLYDMELWHNGAEWETDENITVTLPLPEEIPEERAVVYYMSGSQPQKMSAQVSGEKISFVTNHFSVYMIAEEMLDCEHQSVTDPAVAPTCTEEGLTEGTHCSLCGEILTAQEALAPLGHTPGTEATCSAAQTCVTCGEELLPKFDHTPGEWVIVTEATNAQNGLKEKNCLVCGEQIETEIIPAIGPIYSEGLTFTSNGDGTCTLTSIGTCTDTCISIPEEHGGETVAKIGDYAFAGYKTLTQIIIPESVESIGYAAFKGCEGLTEIAIPDNVTTIGQGSFSNCVNLTKMTIPFIGGSANTGNISDSVLFGYIFSGSDSTGMAAITQNYQYYKHNNFSGTQQITRSTKTNYIPKNLTTVTVTGGDVGYGAFSGCSMLINITLSDDTTSIGAYAFYGCLALKEIVIPDGVTTIGSEAFYNCDSLTEILLPSEISEIGYQAFCDCDGLTELIIPDSVVEIGGSMVKGCSKLKSVTLGSGLSKIGNNAFTDCTELTEMIIPEGVTTIDNDAFNGCRNLIKIVLPNTVTRLHYDMFSNCSSLVEISYNGTIAQWQEMPKYSSWDYNTGNYTIYCSDGKISKDGIVTLF